MDYHRLGRQYPRIATRQPYRQRKYQAVVVNVDVVGDYVGVFKFGTTTPVGAFKFGTTDRVGVTAKSA